MFSLLVVLRRRDTNVAGAPVSGGSEVRARRCAPRRARESNRVSPLGVNAPCEAVVSQPQEENGVKMGRNCNEDGATVKVSFSICFATLRESVDSNHGDNSKDNMTVVLFWKDGRPNSIEYFEDHAVGVL